LSGIANIAYYDNMNVVWNPEDPGLWHSFHASHRGALQQVWAYGEALKAMDVVIHRAMVWDEGQLVAVAQFMCRRVLGYLSVASCTRGPVWAMDVGVGQRQQVYQLLRQTLPLARLKVALFSPDMTLDRVDELSGLSRVMTGYSTVLLDLTKTLPMLKAELDGKWRNRLAKVLGHEKIRFHVQPSRKRCEWLLGKEVDQREVKKFHGLPVEFVRHYINASANPAQAFAVAYAELGKNTIAAMLFIVHGRVASYHMGWADPEGRQLNAHNALLWHAISYFQNQQIEVLDLGGVNTHDLPGISRFKLGTGGDVLTLAGTYF
jgi:hypothetical protein